MVFCGFWKNKISLDSNCANLHLKYELENNLAKIFQVGNRTDDVRAVKVNHMWSDLVFRFKSVKQIKMMRASAV